MRIQSASWSRTALSAVLLLALGVFAAPTAAQPERRVALVVGNSAYAHIGRLPNPGNDAGDMSAALRRLGFEVTTELDADHRALNDALRAVHASERWRSGVAGVLRRPRHGNGRGELPVSTSRDK